MRYPPLAEIGQLFALLLHGKYPGIYISIVPMIIPRNSTKVLSICTIFT